MQIKYTSFNPDSKQIEIPQSSMHGPVPIPQSSMRGPVPISTERVHELCALSFCTF